MNKSQTVLYYRWTITLSNKEDDWNEKNHFKAKGAWRGRDLFHNSRLKGADTSYDWHFNFDRSCIGNNNVFDGICSLRCQIQKILEKSTMMNPTRGEEIMNRTIVLDCQTGNALASCEDCLMYKGCSASRKINWADNFPPPDIYSNHFLDISIKRPASITLPCSHKMPFFMVTALRSQFPDL